MVKSIGNSLCRPLLSVPLNCWAAHVVCSFRLGFNFLLILNGVAAGRGQERAKARAGQWSVLGLLAVTMVTVAPEALVVKCCPVCARKLSRLEILMKCAALEPYVYVYARKLARAGVCVLGPGSRTLAWFRFWASV